jgi:hypothetical protein
MIKYFIAAAAAVFLLAANPSARSETLEIPPERIFPSSAGEVVFHHQMHIKDLGIKCVDCHHSIDAKPLSAERPEKFKSSSTKCPINVKTLSTPHPDYFKSSSIKCVICHTESDASKENAYTCSGCHRTNPMNIADETLSAKVVVHKQCWKCHPVSTGMEASTVCEKCHSGKKTF